MKTLLLASAAALMLGGGSAYGLDDADPGAADAGPTYEADFFERFSPRTALDMVREVPNFSIQSSGEGRGLGQARENVLINGRRVAGKSNTAVDALSRISAGSVIRIEVRDGATLEIPGLSGQVVNVVADLDRISGNWEWSPEFREAVNPALTRGSIALNGQIRGWTYSLGFESDSFRNGSRGPTLIERPDGSLIERRTEDGQFYGDQPSISVNLGHESDAGSVLNLNAQYTLFEFDGRTWSFREAAGQTDRLFNFTESEDEWNAEFGGDYEFDLGPGRLKFIGLQRQEDSPFDIRQRTVYADGRPDTGSRFLRQADEGESILRSEYSWAPREGDDWQIAIEGAFNFLDIASELAELQPDGDFAPVALTNGSSRVEERRAEASVTHTHPIGENLSIQASLAVEYSELSQDGAVGQTREFVRPKGFARLTWTPSETTTHRLSFERRVGQISFFDFIASVDLFNGNNNAGNPELSPPQTWEIGWETTKQMGAYGSVTVDAFYQIIDDIIDIVPIGATGQAVGNLDQAKRYGAGVEATLLFDPYGWEGAKLDVDARIEDSALDDPLTGETRDISRNLVWFLDTTFRWDIPDTNWAVGGGTFYQRRAPRFRLDEFGFFHAEPAFHRVTIEHKDVLGATVSATYSHWISQVNERFERYVYVDRRGGPVDFIQTENRKFGGVLRFEVSKEF